MAIYNGPGDPGPLLLVKRWTRFVELAQFGIQVQNHTFSKILNPIFNIFLNWLILWISRWIWNLDSEICKIQKRLQNWILIKKWVMGCLIHTIYQQKSAISQIFESRIFNLDSIFKSFFKIFEPRFNFLINSFKESNQKFGLNLEILYLES